MPRLYRVVYEEIGEISDEQLEQLEDALVEEDDEDTDFFIDTDTLTYLEGEGVDAAVIALLRDAVGEEGAEIVWEVEEEEGEFEEEEEQA